eukprot:Hpha_TRINITY_DN10470_c0_g2::TRINITY_DN10470_c0_g2_i1::g.193343::m.193343
MLGCEGAVGAVALGGDAAVLPPPPPQPPPPPSSSDEGGEPQLVPVSGPGAGGAGDPRLRAKTDSTDNGPGPCLALLQRANCLLEVGEEIEQLGLVPLDEQDDSVTFFDSRPRKGGWIRFCTQPASEGGGVFYRSNGRARPVFRKARYSWRKGDPPYIDFPDIDRGVLLPAAPHAYKLLLAELACLFSEAGVEHNLPMPARRSTVTAADPQVPCQCAVM